MIAVRPMFALPLIATDKQTSWIGSVVPLSDIERRAAVYQTVLLTPQKNGRPLGHAGEAATRGVWCNHQPTASGGPLRVFPTFYSGFSFGPTRLPFSEISTLNLTGACIELVRAGDTRTTARLGWKCPGRPGRASVSCRV